MNKWVGRPINLFRRNNSTPNVKGGRIRNWIEHLLVWTRIGSCWFSQIWPSQQCCLDTLNLLDEQHSFSGGQLAWAWWKIWMGPNVKRFTCYIWRGWEPLLFMLLILSFDIGLFRLGFLLLFSRVVVLFSIGCPRVGIPPLPLRSLLERFVLYFSISRIESKHQSPSSALLV